jgi:hypothetical protein
MRHILNQVKTNFIPCVELPLRVKILSPFGIFYKIRILAAKVFI